MTGKQNLVTVRCTGYQIRVKGHLDSHWSDWFEGLTITPEEGGVTLLSGPVVDQAALYGYLKTMRDLGLKLISVCPGPCVSVNKTGGDA